MRGVAVVLRSHEDFEQIVEANPFPDAATGTLHVGFMAAAPPEAAIAGLDRERFLPDEFVIAGSEVYLHLPEGMARTKLPGYLDPRLEVATTIRNWNTVAKLLDLAGV
ncbi:MAG: DUF1697 domain-containing protein [Actinobacteria bacterium]|nr:DUF1697 domain-containing protein [Actinomycetota bacterium]